MARLYNLEVRIQEASCSLFIEFLIITMHTFVCAILAKRPGECVMGQRVSVLLHSGDKNDNVSFLCLSRHDSYSC